MKQQGTPETKEPALERPLPLIIVTAASYLIGAAIAMYPHADSIAVAAPTPYSADHAHITSQEAQPPTF